MTRTTEELPEQGRVRGTLGTLFAAGAGAVAVRKLVKLVAKRSLGPVGLVITAVEALLAVKAGIRAISRWRSDRRLRQAMRHESGRPPRRCGGRPGYQVFTGRSARRSGPGRSPRSTLP
jgi:hypothetical protein